MSQPIKKLVIAGGGTAGWMAAALCRKMLPRRVVIELVESEEIGIVGVGEATIPPIQMFNSLLGLNEAEFLRETQGTFKLAIQFENWRKIGESYFHTFGMPGANFAFTSFFHYWLRSQQLGSPVSFWDYDLNYLCCQTGRFGLLESPDPTLQILHAYHFDAALYGRYLRKICEAWGVKRTEGKIQQVQLHPDTGDVDALVLESGERIEGSFFIDCTGMRGLLIQGALNTGYEDWNHWLPCDRALAVPSERFEKTLPYTRAIAHGAGWQWRIPLTHRNGNGMVFSSNHWSEDEAAHQLLSNLETKALGDPKLIKFRTGRSNLAWNKNVVALGLSSGFLEPLESTSIHLVQSALTRLIKLFSGDGQSPEARDNFNRETRLEYESTRDFIILHYHLNERNDTEFWRELREMAIPERLRQKMALFKATGVILNDHLDMFGELNWLKVMFGQGITPDYYNPAAEAPSEATLRELLQRIGASKHQMLSRCPPYETFLRQYVGNPASYHNSGTVSA